MQRRLRKDLCDLPNLFVEITVEFGRMKWNNYILFFLFLPLLSLGQDELSSAQSLYSTGKYEDAIRVLMPVTRVAEPDPMAMKLRGDCYQKLENLEAALSDYDQARKLGYADYDLFLNRGICKISMGRYDEARSDLMACLQRDSRDAKAYYWMATIEYMNLENKASVRYLDEAIYLDSTFADAYFLRAANYVEQKKELFALEDFDMAYKMNPSMHKAKLNMAVLFIDMGRTRSAVELLSELKLEQTDFVAEVLYYRGEARFMLHDLEGACMDWNEAATLGDVDALANQQRLCIDKKGKTRFKKRQYVQF